MKTATVWKYILGNKFAIIIISSSSPSSTSVAGSEFALQDNEWQELWLLTPHNHIIHQSSSSVPLSSSASPSSSSSSSSIINHHQHHPFFCHHHQKTSSTSYFLSQFFDCFHRCTMRYSTQHITRRKIKTTWNFVFGQSPSWRKNLHV